MEIAVREREPREKANAVTLPGGRTIERRKDLKGTVVIDRDETAAHVAELAGRVKPLRQAHRLRFFPIKEESLKKVEGVVGAVHHGDSRLSFLIHISTSSCLEQRQKD
jgi:hypothetical protein